MSDVHTPSQRRYNMSRIRARDTKPELVVRRMLHSMGYRFRLHRNDLPGTPDIVLPRHRKIVEVRGCYWHSHSCRYGSVEPKTNREFWRKKRAGNVQRDKRNLCELRRLGWSVLIIWECEIGDEEKLTRRLLRFLESQP